MQQKFSSCWISEEADALIAKSSATSWVNMALKRRDISVISFPETSLQDKSGLRNGSVLHLVQLLPTSSEFSCGYGLWGPVIILYNHTFPEYLISTILQPRRMYRHTHRPRKRKIAPKLPLLLSPVVRLITPPCYPLRIHGSTATNPFNSNFGEPDVRRLARCFCFILNFVLIFAEFQTCNIFKYFSFHYLFILLRI